MWRLHSLFTTLPSTRLPFSHFSSMVSGSSSDPFRTAEKGVTSNWGLVRFRKRRVGSRTRSSCRRHAWRRRSHRSAGWRPSHRHSLATTIRPFRLRVRRLWHVAISFSKVCLCFRCFLERNARSCLVLARLQRAWYQRQSAEDLSRIGEDQATCRTVGEGTLRRRDATLTLRSGLLRTSHSSELTIS